MKNIVIGLILTLVFNIASAEFQSDEATLGFIIENFESYSYGEQTRLMTTLQERFPGDDRTKKFVLLNLNNENHFYIRKFAAQSLGKLSIDQDIVVPELTKRLEKETVPDVQDGILYALGRIAPKDMQVSDQISEYLNSSNLEVRREAAIALGEINTPSPQTILRLAEKLEDPESSMRADVLTALRKIKPQSKEVQMKIATAFSNETYDMNGNDFLSTLVAISPEEEDVLMEIASGLNNSDPYLQTEVARTLSLLSPITSKAVQKEIANNLANLARINALIYAIKPLENSIDSNTEIQELVFDAFTKGDFYTVSRCDGYPYEWNTLALLAMENISKFHMYYEFGQNRYCTSD